MSRMMARGSGREDQVAQVALETISGDGPWLVAEDATGRVARALRGQAWTRWARDGEPAEATPPEGPFAGAALRLPRDKGALDFAQHQVASRLEPGATLWLYGHNDEGAKSAGKRLAPLFDRVETVATRRHCRVWRGRRTDAPAKAGVAPWLVERTLALPAVGELPWASLPGLFAKGGLDAATSLLLGALDAPPGPEVLDFGCGTGVITHVVGARWPSATLTAVDADALAVEATRRNAPAATVALSDRWHGVPPRTYHRIISNPPIHAGKVEDFTVLRSLVDPPADRLAPWGDLWLVVQRQVPVERLLAERFGQVTLKAETGRFRVWRAAKVRVTA